MTKPAPPPQAPVGDWATDFDLAEPEYNERAVEIWSDLRSRCPVAHTTRYGGAWLPVRHEHIRQIAYDTEHYTSRGVVVGNLRPIVPGPAGAAPPITSDPPFHGEARRLLLPAFAPKRIALLEPDIRLLCQRQLAKLGSVSAGDQIDAAVDYAQQVPGAVMARLLGLPETDHELFRGFVHDLLEGVNLPEDEMARRRDRFDAYLDEQIAAHRRAPQDDLTTFLSEATIDGQPLAPQHVRGTIALLLLAGIDTTWSLLGSSLHHLATHQADLKRLRENPSLLPTAIEEFLRAYAPATMARLVKQSHDFHGHAFQEEDWVLLPFAAANRDPEVFERADEILIDRAVNPHAAFGLGIHRCLGSNLARLELRVALEEFLARFPSFEPGDEAVRWSVGQIRGPRRLSLRLLEVQNPIAPETTIPRTEYTRSRS
ncbi:MAG: cytochrome P450 [Acidimicrobiia bacterium]|nr:cytochrome P450 [Acidimicrobiia bacterium]